MPKVPPRPVRRGVSPNPDRYAPSPLSGGIPSKKDRSNSHGDPIDRSKSVELPAVVGEEGMEYAALEEQLSSREPSTSPTQTRTIGENLKIHAPKAALPAQSAKQRIMQVTRTDSDKAASFGIGKPSADVPSPSNVSLKKKASTTSQLSQSEIEDEERGIPEIGVHVPLLAHAGDVQAPSPAPGASTDASKKNHKRKTSSRGLPPGSYGLHGHNVVAEDKLEKEYYKKHPELLKLEHHTYQHDRATDFSMSREVLDKMVRESELNGHGLGTSDHAGTPSEQAAWAAYSEVASRPHSTKPPGNSPTKHESDPDVIVVDEPNHRRSVLFSDEAIPAPPQDEPESDYRAPILAEDEVRKNTPRFDQAPAVELSRERRGSDYEMEPPRSRPTSRPASLYKVDSSDLRSTPLEDVIEYEPLFPEDDEDTSGKDLTAAQIKELKQRFPSRDIWEDAPNSVHHTAEVNTPEPEDELKKVPSRDQTETPAHAFARKQEELAEKEGTHPDAFLWRTQKPSYIAHQPHLSQEKALWGQHDGRQRQDMSRPNATQRFPSRDVWEDTPDSLRLETTVSGPQMEQASPIDKKPQVPERPERQSSLSKEKPVIPERPKPKSQEEASAKPVIPDRPKPQVPARPVKASGDAPAPKAKPAVPARPAGSKIAALQAGFMADLNKKLGLGPQAPKSEDEDIKAEETVEEPKEKAPLSDTRRGRARGPQRRAPTAAAPPTSKPADVKKPKLSFSTTITIWSLDPEADDLVLDEEELSHSQPVEAALGTTQDGKADEIKDAEVQRDVPDEAEPEAEPETVAEARAEEAKVAQEIEEAEQELDREDMRDVDEKDSHSAESKTQPLATNTAGETLAKATVAEDKTTHKVEPKDVETNVVED